MFASPIILLKRCSRKGILKTEIIHWTYNEKGISETAGHFTFTGTEQDYFCNYISKIKKVDGEP
jgi:hypothetical protein